MTDLADASPASAGHLPGTRDYRRTVIALFAAGVATFALLYSTQALLPELADHFHVTTTQSTLSLSLTTLGIGVTLLIAGPISDVVGRTRLIHLSLASSVVVATACVFAPSWPVLLGLRLLEGVTLAGLPAVATAYLREELHESTHARAVGLYVGGTALGGMAGRLLTGPIGEYAGFRWALASSAILGLACTVVVALMLPASRRFEARPAGLRAMAAATRAAVSDRALIALYLIGGCSMGVLVAVFNTLGFRLLHAPFGLGLGAASLVFAVYPLGSISSAVSGGLADRFGRRAIAPLGVIVAFVGLLVTVPDHLITVVLGLALITIGFFAVHGIASGWVPVRAHAAGVATAQAASLYLFTYYLGSSVFGSLAGRVYSGHGWDGTVVMCAVLLAITGALTVLLQRTPSLLPTAHHDRVHAG